MTYQEHVTKYLETQAEAIARLAPQVNRRLSVKPVHHLRVAIRRARAALWVLRNSSNSVHFKKLNHDLRKLGKVLGEVRELDVAIQDANDYGIDSIKLTSRRKTKQTKLQKLINRNQRHNLAMQFFSLKNAALTLSPNLSEARDNLRLQLNRQLERHIHGKTKLHRLRITMKKTRYALEALGRPVEPIKRLQTILGDAHDLEILQTLVGKNPKIKADQHVLNDKGVRLVKPALRFAVTQLGAT